MPLYLSNCTIPRFQLSTHHFSRNYRLELYSKAQSRTAWFLCQCIHTIRRQTKRRAALEGTGTHMKTVGANCLFHSRIDTCWIAPLVHYHVSVTDASVSMNLRCGPYILGWLATIWVLVRLIDWIHLFNSWLLLTHLFDQSIQHETAHHWDMTIRNPSPTTHESWRRALAFWNRRRAKNHSRCVDISNVCHCRE